MMSSATGRIVFTSERNDSEDVTIMNADGTAQTRLTFNPDLDSYADWGSVVASK